MAYRNEKAEFVEWLKLGTRQARIAAGEPPTVTAWAEKYGVQRETAQRWKNDPDVKKAVADHGLTLFTVDEIARARQTLVKRAIEDGNVPALKMMLEIAGLIGKNVQETAPPMTPNTFSKMSDEELERALAEDDED
jgi:hypothetical protein